MRGTTGRGSPGGATESAMLHRRADPARIGRRPRAEWSVRGMAVWYCVGSGVPRKAR